MESQDGWKLLFGELSQEQREEFRKWMAAEYVSRELRVAFVDPNFKDLEASALAAVKGKISAFPDSGFRRSLGSLATVFVPSLAGALPQNAQRLNQILSRSQPRRQAPAPFVPPQLPPASAVVGGERRVPPPSRLLFSPQHVVQPHPPPHLEVVAQEGPIFEEFNEGQMRGEGERKRAREETQPSSSSSGSSSSGLSSSSSAEVEVDEETLPLSVQDARRFGQAASADFEKWFDSLDEDEKNEVAEAEADGQLSAHLTKQNLAVVQRFREEQEGSDLEYHKEVKREARNRVMETATLRRENATKKEINRREEEEQRAIGVVPERCQAKGKSFYSRVRTVLLAGGKDKKEVPSIEALRGALDWFHSVLFSPDPLRMLQRRLVWERKSPDPLEMPFSTEQIREEVLGALRFFLKNILSALVGLPALGSRAPQRPGVVFLIENGRDEEIVARGRTPPAIGLSVLLRRYLWFLETVFDWLGKQQEDALASGFREYIPFFGEEQRAFAGELDLINEIYSLLQSGSHESFFEARMQNLEALMNAEWEASKGRLRRRVAAAAPPIVDPFTGEVSSCSNPYERTGEERRALRKRVGLTEGPIGKEEEDDEREEEEEEEEDEDEKNGEEEDEGEERREGEGEGENEEEEEGGSQNNAEAGSFSSFDSDKTIWPTARSSSFKRKGETPSYQILRYRKAFMPPKTVDFAYPIHVAGGGGSYREGRLWGPGQSRGESLLYGHHFDGTPLRLGHH